MKRLCVGVAVVAGVLIAFRHPGFQNDFQFDWLLAKAFISGLDPYVPMSHLAGHFGLQSHLVDFIGPRTPAALIFQAPVGVIPFDWVFVVGRLLTVGSAFVYAVVLAKLAKGDWAWFVAATPVVLLIPPFPGVVYTSQTGFLVGSLIGLTWLAGDRYVAGLPLAIAVSLKLWPWLLIPGLWLTGRRKASYGAAGGFVGFNLAGLALPKLSTGGVMAMLSDARQIHSAVSFDVHPVILAAFGLAVVVVGSRWVNAYMLGIPVGLIVAPILWTHYLPAVLVLVSKESRVLNDRPEGGEPITRLVLIQPTDTE